MKTRWIPVLLAGLALVPAVAWATPSTQVWIPSPTAQKFATVHLNLDTYVRAGREADGSLKPPIFMLGPTVGILPFEKFHMEVGFDLTIQGVEGYDRRPLYFHAKMSVPEDAMGTWSPAFALGIQGVGIRWSGPFRTDQNVVYALVGRTLPYVGRLSFGYFVGNPDVLVDQDGSAAHHGFLASWDRTMTEVSDKWWLAVDYQGGRSALASVNFGTAWAFSPNASVIVGYDLYLNRAVAGRDTVTVQVDLDF